MVNRITAVLLGLTSLATVDGASAQSVPESRFFDSDGVRIHYIEAGSGEPVLLLHGNTSRVDRWLETGVFEGLAEHYWVIAYDARAHGRSDKPHDVSAYGTEVALDAVRLLDHLRIERAHILGYSMGARVVGSLMTSHPDRFRSVILGGFAPAWNWSPEDEEAVEERAAGLRMDPPSWLIAAGQDTEALAANILGFPALAVTDRALAEVKIPALALVGSEDQNLGRVMDLKGLMPDMKVVVIEGASHSGAYGRSEFLEEVLLFLAGNEQGA
jgi:pimeloyl-ACP methyl ester carboxylesterase